ncbi:Beta-barrel assembly machine subunit BamE [Hymenobacter roseosalivarius DSM 11622]|uniref:Beta-barrel assembly machine subunit BamE n=2 Tax=Hymenobacter roseosalivarius TaxID=89967 RepID=A0A1W1V591_9BACT|nr:Beta-barrel assembly machine subunit BamE [Hymenobacter roseosalivarius DSM 11622]
MVLGILAVAGFIYYTLTTGPQVYEGMHNSEKLRQVKIGMTRQQAITIMGPPLSKRVLLPGLGGAYNTPVTIYNYRTSPLASDAIAFVLDPDSIVVGTSHGK